MLLESSETDVLVLSGGTPFNGFFHKSFNTYCHSSPLMTRRVNFTSARMVTHSTAIPMLKPKNTSMIWNITLPRSLRLFQKGGTCTAFTRARTPSLIIRLRYHNHLGKQYALPVDHARALYTPGAVLSSFNHCRNAPSITRLRSSFRSLATVSTAEITSLSKRILTAERPGCIGGRPAPGRGPPGLLFFLVATLVLPCFGGGILENGTEAQKQEQYRPQANDVRWKRRSLRTHACLSTVNWLGFLESVVVAAPVPW